MFEIDLGLSGHLYLTFYDFLDLHVTRSDYGIASFFRFGHLT